MAYEIKPDDQLSLLRFSGSLANYYHPEHLLAAAVNGPPIKRKRLYAVAECTICGCPYEWHGEFDPAEANRVPRCRCCRTTKTVPVRLAIRPVRSVVRR